MRALPAIYRDILIMREVNELSYEEIADILAISIGTVKSRISRARVVDAGRVITAFIPTGIIGFALYKVVKTYLLDSETIVSRPSTV